MDQDLFTDLRLSEEQRAAAWCRGCDVAVLAGAGSGKTATLVAHYLYLVAQGVDPRQVVAITFTERAGEEMRSRIRRQLLSQLERMTDPERRPEWLECYVAIDEAPIGTIHSLCARLLREHPAEVGLDPRFVVLEEGRTAALRAEAVERALAWAVREPSAAACFPLLGGPEGLRELLEVLLGRRLDVEEALARTPGDVLALWVSARCEWLTDVLDSAEWEEHVRALEDHRPLVPGDALDERRRAAICAVREARACVRAGDWGGALERLGAGLGAPGNVGTRQSWGGAAPEVRRHLRELYDLYTREIRRTVEPADPALDEELAGAWPAVIALFRQAVAQYRALKAEQQAVDFDDLEAGALRLLEEHPEVAAYHQGRIQAVLVDEFQDTNDRQRRLLEALLGAPAGHSDRLFIVGDAKQSIYRFRGADVTVFRSVEGQIRAAGGKVHYLARSYRAHAGLVGLLNRLLERVLGTEDDPRQLYRVPFAPLIADRSQARVQPPYIELHLGIGMTALEGREIAAAALARRLLRLHEEEGVAWGHVACLFRAMTNAPVYESAFEHAGIPYVTIAGTGFLDRPEVRDLLNALRALAAPEDDLALAGLLRSPGIGLSDASLYLLRWGKGDRPRPLATALGGDLSMLDAEERARAVRAAGILSDLAPLVGREPVAAVLKRFLDATNYLAILRLCPEGERAARNVAKLLGDAHRSGAVSVVEFLSYLQTLRDAAVREGEAPPEGGEAVQLMSVHKAKGLEFPVVVIADAGYEKRNTLPRALVHPRWGLLVAVSTAEGSERRTGLAHRLAYRDEQAMEDAEERRLLYVAATRASEKLLISGHASYGKSGLGLAGWADRIAAAIDEAVLHSARPADDREAALALWGGEISCTLYGSAWSVPAPERPQPAEAGPVERGEEVILAPLAAPCPASREAEPPLLPRAVWRIVPKRPTARPPSWVVGTLVHLGLRLWQPWDDPRLAAAMQARARQAGLTDPGQIGRAVRAALRLIRRFQESELYGRLKAAEHWHELSYCRRVDPWGRIDLLCHLPDGEWWIVDFKVNRLTSEASLETAVQEYAGQLERYRGAVRELLGAQARAFLCFMNYRGRTCVREIGTRM